MSAELGPWLHLRGQFTYHAEARIVGTVDGLIALREAITAALETGEAEAEVFASDGEGYGIVITRSSTIEGLGEPEYLDQAARELAQFERDFFKLCDQRDRVKSRDTSHD